MMSQKDMYTLYCKWESWARDNCLVSRQATTQTALANRHVDVSCGQVKTNLGVGADASTWARLCSFAMFICTLHNKNNRFLHNFSRLIIGSCLCSCHQKTRNWELILKLKLFRDKIHTKQVKEKYFFLICAITFRITLFCYGKFNSLESAYITLCIPFITYVFIPFITYVFIQKEKNSDLLKVQ